MVTNKKKLKFIYKRKIQVLNPKLCLINQNLVNTSTTYLFLGIKFHSSNKMSFLKIKKL